ncbi:ATP-binding cassette, subfamily B [Propionibacterium cyclohexanicum]|uniref:ATP-binding cassette, subfamily B n=1 Tax=Propionibacterium cyclohexanicum TaxID=64702 RepID=A0A1H9TD01_9ACTN|nr:ABC transporter ATP-binding protein [Propionibacterium cyclohexanicum]SER94998.1 ATP-binding cassette, subfamily B [Propionibacterium cyclohexanicum]
MSGAFTPMHGPTRVDPEDRRQLDESPVRLRAVLALFSGHRLRMGAVAAIIVVASLVSLAQPFLLREVIDQALPHHNTALLVKLVAGMILIAVVSGVLGVWQTWLAAVTGEHVTHELRTRVFAHLQRQSIAFYKKTRGGEIQSRLLQDVAGLQAVITTTATSIASNLTATVATAVAMIALNWRLSLISLVVLPPASLLTRQVALVRREVMERRQRTLADLHTQVDDALSINGALLAKTLGSEAQTLEQFTRTSSTLIDLDVRAQLAGRWRMAVMSIIFAAIPALLYLTAGFPGLWGDISIGTLIAFASLQTSIFRPIQGLLNTGAQWVSSMALLSRIFGYLDLPVEVAEPVHPVPVDPREVKGLVRLDHVSYRFADGTQDALRDIDLTIEPGHWLAVVGETGSGKSTLASLLVRLADPTRGTVSIDGVDLRRITSRDRSRIVGMVTQETYLAHASIEENLRRAAPGASRADLLRVLEIAQLDALIAALPQGLQTTVGARGHRFSGGERQRLAIARTLLVNPPVLILDEATSALDTETERELQTALNRLMVGRTTLTIAHRLSTIRDADEIVVLDHGRIVERGRHSELLAAGGRYAQMAR